MKARILKLLLFSVICIEYTFCQYIPMVQENKFWIHQRYYDSETGQVGWGYLLNFEGDTLINSVLYKKLWHQELAGTHPCPMGFAPCFVFDQPYKIISRYLMGFAREDSSEQKVYYKPAIGLYCDAEEYVLFDFSLQVNDALDSCKKEALGGVPYFGNIESISVDQYWGTMRKVFHTTGYTSVLHLQVEGEVKLIEGIGFDSYGLFHGSHDLSHLYDYCEGSLSECNIISKTTEWNSAEDISLYPNPGSNIVYVGEDIIMASAVAVSLSGQVTQVECYGNSIDIAGLTSGFYILHIKAQDGKAFRTKMVKG